MASRRIRQIGVCIAISIAFGVAWWVQRPAPAASATEDVPSGASASRASQPTKPPVATAGGARADAQRPAPVEVIKVQTMSLADQADAVGTLQSRRSVTIRPEVSGRIVRLNFQDGQRVQSGQLLVQLDDQLQQAQVQQSQAERSIAQANHTRNQELVAKGFVSQRSLDESAAALQVADAKLALAQATAARLKMLAPFTGVVGIRKVNAGEYIKDGSDIVNIEDLDAMLLNYRLPERLQPQIKPGQTVSVVLDALPAQSYTAVVQAINPQIDTQGRSVAVQACLNNAGGVLRPGMFARVSVALGRQRQALVVPEQAVVADASGVHVFKVVAQEVVTTLQNKQATEQATEQPSNQSTPATDAEKKTTKVAQKVAVQLGWRGQGLVEVVSGLAADDTIIIAGQQRIKRDGAAVRVVDAPAAASDVSAPNAPASGEKGANLQAGAALVVPAPVLNKPASSPAKASAQPCALGREVNHANR
jgi:membrane fusion protein, multidrug efflux system